MASTTANESTKRVLTDANATTGAAKKAKKVKTITKKELNDKVKYSVKSELVSLLKTIFEEYPEALKALEYHTPNNAPLSPLPVDPLLKQCFHCHEANDLLDFFGVKICSACNVDTLTRDQVMDYFNFTKPQADKIKRRTGNGMYGGIKYIYDVDTVVKAVKKRDGGSLFTFVARSSGRSPPTTGEALQAASTKAKKKKVIADALKHSDESTLQYRLKQVVDLVPELKAIDGVIASFTPSKMPIKPSPNDPLLQQCFICHSSDDLQAFYDIKVCACCDLNSGKHGGTLTRDRVMSYFHFTKTEADKISRKKTTGGMYRSMIYVYNVKTVVTAAKKKYGSLYMMVKRNTPSYLFAK